MSDEGAKPPMDLVFVETHDREWVVHRCDSAGMVLSTNTGIAGDDGHANQAAVERAVSDKAKSGDSFVVVCYQKERVLGDLGCRPFGSRAVVDLYQMAWLLVAVGQVKDRKLETLMGWCDSLGKTAEPSDRVVAVRNCYLRMVQRIRTGLQVEGLGREIVSSAKQSLMKFMGELNTKD